MFSSQCGDVRQEWSRGEVDLRRTSSVSSSVFCSHRILETEVHSVFSVKTGSIFAGFYE